MKSTHRAKDDASRRTKNRFREHTLVLVRELPLWSDNWSSNDSVFRGTSLLFESTEKDEKGKFAKWCGWIPSIEVERIKE
jgi:hypothetical protein|tara:strand:- start:9568 stop:9807 length:240 start_codon:yes stop_codon:yes gene_type:complete